MVEDKELIRQYAATRSEAAFAELVRRHLNLVYAAALRQVNGDCHLAEDVAQSVFVVLARKAGKLQSAGSIAGWLYTSTRFAAANAVRSEARRRVREQTVAAMNEMHTDSSADWDELRPIIDEALARLSDADREAIVLRYFESMEFSLVGAALGVSERGARMRVFRALAKLRDGLQRRGLTTTDAALAGALVESSSVAVPAHLATGISHAALSHAAAAGSSSATSTILKVIAMKKIALVIIAVVVISLATVGVVKVAHKWRDPGFKVYESKIRVTLAPDETLVTGGWSFEDGKRVFVFITPTWIDPAGNRASAPSPQVTIEAQFVEAPDPEMEKLGLKSLFVAQNESSVAEKYSPAQWQSLMHAFKARDGVDILAAPKVTTLTGHQARIAVQSEQKISDKSVLGWHLIIGHPSQSAQRIPGKTIQVGPSLDLLPSVSSDGKSIDLTGTAQIVQATK